MKVFVLGLDGATWDVLRPAGPGRGHCRNLARLMAQGVSGHAPVGLPAAQPGGLDRRDDGEELGQARGLRVPRVRPQPARRAGELVAGDQGRAGLGDRRPARQEDGRGRRADELSRRGQAPGFFLGDFLSPADAPDFASDPAIFAELEQAVGPYRPWSTAVHDGGHEAETLAELTRVPRPAPQGRPVPDGPVRLGPVHVRPDGHRPHPARALARLGPTHRRRGAGARPVGACEPGCVEFWKRLDRGIGAIEAALPADTALILMSDHGFGPIEWYVNFNVWLLEQGDIALAGLVLRQAEALVLRARGDARVVLRPDGPARPGQAAGQPVPGQADRAGSSGWRESAFLSRRHIDWSRTQAYAQGNFGQIFLNLKGRQPHGCVAARGRPAAARRPQGGPAGDPPPRDGRAAGRAGLRARRALPRPARPPRPRPDGRPARLAVPDDRPARLHDEPAHLARLRPDRRPPDGGGPDRRPARRSAPGRRPDDADLLDIAPTVLHLLGVPVPDDMDGRVLDRDPRPRLRPVRRAATESEDAAPPPPTSPFPSPTPRKKTPRSSSGWPTSGICESY